MRRYYAGRYRPEADLVEELREELLNDLRNSTRGGSYRRPYSRREIAALKRDLYRELQVLRDMEERLQRNGSPEVMTVLRELLDETRTEGLSLRDLVDNLPRNCGGVMSRLPDFFNRGNTLTLLLILLALVSVPALRDKLRPLITAILEHLFALLGSAQQLLAQIKEGVEDIVAEAQFERLKDSLGEKGEQQPPAEG
ncbi:hypothetical protein GFC01_05635 [Desulfofundulus thermobenzoicus]|uniref:Uncharacterized protein n=1 Tax=Desulfofundulus thermobenzoicus TaxID=29376 RepID=A0A6N7IP74_9FIRM|nr:hypothetical protein [Desulfofundulus thermobenzoicus]MQL51750.1 hypothetical protein [Desulfofundulus thermobenzoicus]